MDLSGRVLERRVLNSGTGYRLPILKDGVYMVRIDQQGMVKVYRLIISEREGLSDRELPSLGSFPIF